MSAELLGGERVAITADRRKVHVFERTMSTARQHALEASQAAHIDVWRLVTPMSGKQRVRLDTVAPKPAVDAAAPPAERLDAIWAGVRVNAARERVNTRTRTAKSRRVDDDEFTEHYELGYGIPKVADWKLWHILDAHALRGVREIDARDLSRLVTRPQRR